MSERPATVLYTPLPLFGKHDWREITDKEEARDLSKFLESPNNLE
jgi:hypothetical protein